MGMMESTLRQNHPATPGEKCRLCGCRLDDKRPGENVALGVCAECNQRPEARKLGPKPAPSGGRSPARAFTPADKSLIRQVSGFMPLPKMLGLLNERLFADLGPNAAPYTQDQLHEELRGTVGAQSISGDWAGIRQILNAAQRAGTLARIDEQLINDFAVVFSLTPAQVMRLKDVILDAIPGDDE